MDLVLNTRQEQQINLSQQMLTSLKILNLSNQELMDFLMEESESNPAVDEEELWNSRIKLYETAEFNKLSNYANPIGSFSGNDWDGLACVRENETLTDDLLWQLRMLHVPDSIQLAGEWIIGNLDEKGFFYLPQAAIPISSELFQETLRWIQSLDPPGIGARSVQESLILQLHRKGIQNPVLDQIIQEDLEALAGWRFDFLRKKYRIQDPEPMLLLLQDLNPYPSNGYQTGAVASPAFPEIEFKSGLDGSPVQVNLLNDVFPRIRVSQDYLNLIRDAKPGEAPLCWQYVHRLHGIIEAVEKRNQTLLRVCEAIAHHQASFLNGDISYVQPLTMKTVADSLDLSVSTVSRCIREKHAAYNGKILPLKMFFTNGMKSTTEEKCSSEIESMIRAIIQSEDKKHPLSDEQLTQILNRRGIEIKRRTVAKYRDLLGIPTVLVRKRKTVESLHS